MTEIIFRKRAAKAGEIGLFVETEVFDEEWRSLKMDSEIKAECTTPANLKYTKFFHALVGKVADNSPDEFLDKDDAKERVLIAARHCKLIHDHLRNKAEVRAKSVAGLSGDTWLRLLRRVTHVVITQYLPGVEESALKAEIEKMIGIDVFAAPPVVEPKPRARRAKKSDDNAPHAASSDPQKEVQETAGEGQGMEPGNPPSKPSAPTNEAEYIQACMSWLKKQTDRFKAFDHYNGPVHQKMRLDLKISTGTRKSLERQIGEFFDGQDRIAREAAKGSEGRKPQGDDRKSGQADQAVD